MMGSSWRASCSMERSWVDGAVVNRNSIGADAGNHEELAQGLLALDGVVCLTEVTYPAALRPRK